jgi:hypothetical protein
VGIRLNCTLGSMIDIRLTADNCHMCYSAQIRSEHKKYVRYVGRENALDIKAFFRKYWERINDSPVKIPKAIDSWFADDPDAHANNIQHYEHRMAA